MCQLTLLQALGEDDDRFLRIIERCRPAMIETSKLLQDFCMIRIRSEYSVVCIFGRIILITA